MARQAMVTRTVETYDCLVLCVNPATDETMDRVFTVSAKLKDDKAIIKALAKEGIDGGLTPLYVKSKVLKTTLYGMSEQKFLMNADILPSRTEKQ